MKAVFLDAQSLTDLNLDTLAQCFNDFTAYDATSSYEVADRVCGADVIIVNKVVLDSDTLVSNPSLKLICVVATGVNNVDLEVARSQGIAVFNCQAYGVPSVVQHTFSLMLALQTNLLNYDQAVRAGEWQKSTQFCLLDFPIRELSGKTLGLIGSGNLGQGVAEVAKAFGMKVFIGARPGTAPTEGRVALAELYRQSDVISLHCPLTEQTENLINVDVFNQMKPEAILINVARGGIVNEADLADALRKGKIAGAATDVLISEPPTSGNPLLAGDIPNLIITPHSAWGSIEARQRILDQTIENIKAFRAGDTLRRIV